MEGTAQEFHSLTSTFGFYALYHARSHSRNMSDIWHLLVVGLLQSSCMSQHWENPQNACPALLATKSCLGCPWEAEAAQESGVGGWCHTWCACQWADTLTTDCDMSLTWDHAVLLQLGAQCRLCSNCTLFSSAWQSHQEAQESEPAPRFQGFCTPIKRRRKEWCA